MQQSQRIIMKYKLLGNSGLRVSDFALGTMTFGEYWGWGTRKDESQPLVVDGFADAARLSRLRQL